MEPVITTSLARIQTDPQAVNPVATAFFSKTIETDGAKFEAPWASVSWPLASDKTVVVGENTYTYAEVSAAVVAIAYQEKALADAPPPAPEPVVEEPAVESSTEPPAE